MYRNDNSNYHRPSYKTKQQRPQQLPPMMSGINIQDQTPIANSHQTASSHFELQQPQSPLPPFANGRASTPKLSGTNHHNHQSSINRNVMTTPSPSSKKAILNQHVSPSSKTRQSFHQKIEEARMLASPSRIDRELKVEVKFDPTTTKTSADVSKQQESNTEIFKSNNDTKYISSLYSSGFDEEADKERKKIQEEIRRNAVSPSPLQERNEAAAEVTWCRFALSKLEDQDQFGLNKYAMKRKMRIEAAKERKRQRILEERKKIEEEAKTNPQGALGVVRLNSAAINRLSARDRLIYHHRRKLFEGLENDEEEEELEEEEEEEEEEEKTDNNNNKSKRRIDSASLHRQHVKDEMMQPGIVNKQIAPPLAQFARKIQQTGKDKFINAYFNEFKDWNIEEMLYAAEAEHGENFIRDTILATTGNPTSTTANANTNVNLVKNQKNNKATTKTTTSSSSIPAGGKHKNISASSTTPEELSAMKETLRASFQVAFSPLQVKIAEMFKGQDLTSGALGSLRTFDQRVSFLKKKLLIEEANKRRNSVKFIRDITESLRHDEALFNSFSQEVRQEQIQRILAHRKIQEIRERERQIFQSRTPQQRAEDFRKVEAIKQEKAEQSKTEIEETYFAYCSNALAMRRGAEFSRQYAWSPIIIFVLSLQKFVTSLKAAQASVAEQRVLKSAQRDFGSIFVPTKVTGFLRLAQGYKEAAKKRSEAAAGLMSPTGMASVMNKQERLVMQEVRKKREYYVELKKQELDHPQYMFDRLFAKLRELQFPIFLKLFMRRRRHRSANILVSFLRTLFQQTVIRVRCKCYLRYMRACNSAFLQAIRNRRTRRNFVWGLQFRHYVNERRMYDLPTCVQADHVLKRRERIRAKCAQDKKKAMEAVELLRMKIVSKKVEAVVGSAIASNNKENEKNNRNNGSDDDDDDYDNRNNNSPNQKSPLLNNNSNNNRPTSPFSQSSNKNNNTSATGSTSYQNTRPGTAATTINNNNHSSPSPIRAIGNNHNNSFAPGTPTFYSGVNEQNNFSSTNQFHQSQIQQQAASTTTAAAFINNPTAYFVHLAQTNPQAAVAAAQTEKDIARILASPVMVEHPYGKFGPSPREASIVARAAMDHFRCNEIKWSPSETSMLALLEFVQRLEDKLLYPQYVEWIRVNRQHRERLDFLESVLSHIREDAPTKEDLEKQYKTLLEAKPLPPRQPYILPASEMRVIVFAAYTLTAQEKRSLAKLAKNSNNGNGNGDEETNNNNAHNGGETMKKNLTSNNNNNNNNNNNAQTPGVVFTHHNTIHTLHPDNQHVLTANSSCPSVSGMYAFKNLPDGKPNPIYLESNLKSHLSKAMALFPELHGNVRPFMLEALKE